MKKNFILLFTFYCLTGYGQFFSYSYYDNGNKLEEIPIKNGKVDGNRKEWFEDGTIKKEEMYADGKKDGKSIYYYENGERRLNLGFSKGIKSGLYQAWDSLGNEYYEETFKDGFRDPDESYFYYEEGVKVDYWDKSEKMPDGLKVVYYSNGQKLSEGYYKTTEKAVTGSTILLTEENDLKVIILIKANGAAYGQTGFPPAKKNMKALISTEEKQDTGCFGIPTEF